MSRKIKVKLDGRSISSAIKELEKYRDSLNDKSHDLVEAVAKLGAETARASGGTYASGNSFDVVADYSGTDVKALMVGTGSEITKEWGESDNQRKSATINSLLMDEFGSGAMAEVLFEGVEGIGGRGTLNTYGNAYRDEWYWNDRGFVEYSSGEIPSHPMHNASMEMQQNAAKIAKQIFGN